MEKLSAKAELFVKAYHNRRFLEPVFYDTVSGKLLLKEEYEYMENYYKDSAVLFDSKLNGKEDVLERLMTGYISPVVLARSKFFEDAVDREFYSGCNQYCILPSGYDTYIQRNHRYGLKVFEIDRKTILDDKKERLEREKIERLPTFIPCDYYKEDFGKKLFDAGFNRKEKAVFTLSGIGIMLNKRSFESLIKSIGKLSSSLVTIAFDYHNGEGEKEYTEEELMKLLSRCGFHMYEHMTGEEITSKYFTLHNKLNPQYEMKAPLKTAFCLAVKKGEWK